MLTQKEFFDEYKCEDAFKQSGLEWNVLSDIYDDYKSKSDNLESIKDELIYYLKQSPGWSDYHFHSVSGRVKDGMHLIEKIIRKCGTERSTKYQGINCSNYLDIIRDTIGIRILSLSKENWVSAFNLIMNKFKIDDSDKLIAEDPKAYTRYGDRDIYGDLINQQHSNIGYRSQHYIVRFMGVYCEIQARTLAEEVYGEFDHKVKYPYKNSNKFLKRYTSIVSQHLDAVDEMISTCLQMDDKLIDDADHFFENDTYKDWKTTSFPSVLGPHEDEKIEANDFNENGYVALDKYYDYKLLRKGLVQDELSE